MQTRSNFEKVARSYLGVPYVWGGETREGGMDCSGYVYRVLSDLGAGIPRLTAQGYYNAFRARECKLAQAEKGDLLFFGTSKSNITHIAFYLAGDSMIESGGGGSANTSLANAGEGVRIRGIRSDIVAVCKVPYAEEVKKSMTFTVGLIRKGSTGNQVLLAQEVLKARGFYQGALDKSFGDQMVSATKSYQLERIKAGADMGCGSTPDGEIGEKTWNDMLAI